MTPMMSNAVHLTPAASDSARKICEDAAKRRAEFERADETVSKATAAVGPARVAVEKAELAAVNNDAAIPAWTHARDMLTLAERRLGLATKARDDAEEAKRVADHRVMNEVEFPPLLRRGLTKAAFHARNEALYTRYVELAVALTDMEAALIANAADAVAARREFDAKFSGHNPPTQVERVSIDDAYQAARARLAEYVQKKSHGVRDNDGWVVGFVKVSLIQGFMNANAQAVRDDEGGSHVKVTR